MPTIYKRNCHNCNEYYEKPNIKFCSDKCYRKLQKETITEETRKKISKNNSGKNAWNWKYLNVNYNVLHSWVRRHKGIPQKCLHCEKQWDKPKSIQWANIDHKYRRVLEDYIPLCFKCHRNYDKKTSEFCNIIGCNNKYYSSGYCKKHDSRFYYRKKLAKTNKKYNVGI